MRQQLCLDEFDIELRYKKGIYNAEGDCLEWIDSNAHRIVDVEDIPCFIMEQTNHVAEDELLIADSDFTDLRESIQVEEYPHRTIFRQTVQEIELLYHKLNTIIQESSCIL